ncbi:MAG TPA: Wzz/FepE/Etk N-terminal domain-containing protein [Bryobacteraceae bacterium]|nr:Wzz/FepE/Etk N-terminal domain-containing protein [Bryobacteraceae bacterium]
MADSLESSLSTGRRALDMEDYLDMLRRQKAWILGPTFAAVVVAVVVAFLWPDTYVSSATVRVVPSQVPEIYVPSNVNMEMSARINSMAQTILSRGTLTNIINTHGLYPRERARLPMEDVVENMRKSDVSISNVVTFTTGEGKRQVPAFQISFKYFDRLLAQKVCQDLVSRFVNENMRERTNQSVFTTQFLKDQLEMQRRELEVVEDKLARFKVNNAGKLPDQVQQNLQQLNALEQRFTNLNSTISRINQEKLLMESSLRIYKDQLNTVGSNTETVVLQQQQQQVNSKNERLTRLEGDIQQMELQIAALKENYRESHPNVQQALATLSVLKRQKEALEKVESAKKPEAAPKEQTRTVPNVAAIREARELENTIKKLQSSIEAKDIEMDETKREAQRVDQAIKTTQSRIDATPLGEKDYLDLLRERDLVRARVEDMNKRQATSKVATELENRQQGENLELLDPASVPMKPAEPNRAFIVGGGAAIGLMLGIFLAGARELKDSSLKNLKDVRAYTQLNILGSIPLLENDLVVRRRRRLGWLAWSTACIVGVLVMSGSMYYYYFLVKV